MLNLFYIPALILILFFVVYPLLEAFRISFTQWNGYSQDYKYIGFSNYAKLFKDENFRTAFINTIIYGFGSTLLQNVFGLAYAVFLNSRFRGHSVVRTFIYLPAMISGLIMGYIIYFFVMYNHGVFNEIIGWFGAAPVDWMADGPRGVIIMTLINSWQLLVSVWLFIWQDFRMYHRCIWKLRKSMEQIPGSVSVILHFRYFFHRSLQQLS